MCGAGANVFQVRSAELCCAVPVLKKIISGFIWHFSGLDKYLVKYLVSMGLGNKNSSYSTLDLT